MDRYQTIFQGSDGKSYTRDQIKSLVQSGSGTDDNAIEDKVWSWAQEQFEKEGVRPSVEAMNEYKSILKREPEQEQGTPLQAESGGGGIVGGIKDIVTGIQAARVLPKLVDWALGTGEGQQQQTDESKNPVSGVPNNVDISHSGYGSAIQPNQPIQQAQAQTPEAPTQRPTIKTDADYDALPSGAEFIDPQGNVRRKP